jgi:hypothetical protein
MARAVNLEGGSGNTNLGARILRTPASRVLAGVAGCCTCALRDLRVKDINPDTSTITVLFAKGKQAGYLVVSLEEGSYRLTEVIGLERFGHENVGSSGGSSGHVFVADVGGDYRHRGSHNGRVVADDVEYLPAIQLRDSDVQDDHYYGRVPGGFQTGDPVGADHSFESQGAKH